MGDLVELKPTPRRRPARPARRSKTALVLGGGGFTGAVYEIGALRALDLLSTNRSVADFDVIVGTSAGSVVAAMLANRISPAEMMRGLDGRASEDVPELDFGTLLRLNKSELLLGLLRLPVQLTGLARALGRSLGSFSTVDLAIGLADALPSGLYTGEGVESYLRELLSEAGRTDDFRALGRELYLTATDLDTCERIVLGAEGWDDVPISSAVRASTALPMIYSPHRVKGRELVDGGIVSTTHVDIAVEAGARLIVVVNPLVPFINDGPRRRPVSGMGFPRVGYQTFKLLAYQRLHEMASRWQERYPGVDFVLVEPEPDDELMFQTNVLNYASRVDVARHGFQSVTVKLAQDYDALRDVCARHGIAISAARVQKVVRHFEDERERTGAWRRILEQTTSALLRQSSAE